MIDAITIATGLGGAQLVLITVFTSSAGFLNRPLFKFNSALLGVTLMCISFGRFMGWPL